jgi:hypothetical protein
MALTAVVTVIRSFDNDAADIRRLLDGHGRAIGSIKGVDGQGDEEPCIFLASRGREVRGGDIKVWEGSKTGIVDGGVGEERGCPFVGRRLGCGLLFCVWVKMGGGPSSDLCLVATVVSLAWGGCGLGCWGSCCQYEAAVGWVALAAVWLN